MKESTVSTPTAAPAARPASRARRRGAAPARGWTELLAGPLAQAGDIVVFGVRVLWSAVRHPIGYWGEVRNQLYEALRLCWFPMVISSTAFGLGTVGIQAGNL